MDKTYKRHSFTKLWIATAMFISAVSQPVLLHRKQLMQILYDNYGDNY